MITVPLLGKLSASAISRTVSLHQMLSRGRTTSATSSKRCLPASQVTTVEIDPVIAGAARTALDAAGYPVETVIGDGADGWPAHGRYDRVIATVASHLGALPYEWVRQTAPGGVIVAPMRADYVGSGPLVRFTVDDDGLATGPPDHAVGFMPLRQGHPWGSTVWAAGLGPDRGSKVPTAQDSVLMHERSLSED